MAGKLISLDGGKRFKHTAKTWWSKILHAFRHDWTSWSDGTIINIYFGNNKETPNRRELRQVRKCEVCSLKQARRVDY